MLFSALMCCVFADVPAPAAPQLGSPAAMHEVFYSVGSRVKNPEDLGGFGGSRNLPEAIPDDVKNDPKAAPDALSILVRPSQLRRTADAPELKFDVIIANRTKKRIAFPAQDSGLSLRQEAKTAAGEWKPIEYMPSSWCGNSYHTVYLGPNECWKVRGDVYSGPFKTKLRYALTAANGQRFYSEEFEGSIHEAQFNEPVKRPLRENVENQR